MANPLQEQLLKAGLIKKAKLAEVTRQQAKARHGKAPAANAGEAVDAARLKAERAERDRAIAAERNARTREAELTAQARQIIETNRIAAQGEIEYGFTDGERIRRLPVDAAQRAQLAKGALVIVRRGDSYALLPRAAGEKVRERDASLIVLDHGVDTEARRSKQDGNDSDDDYYSRFEVPDDLTW